MDEFFQKLREIQKKERNLSGLAPVGENFYQEVSKYFNVLMRKIDNNPFSFESYLLRDAQRIVAEICERREHKISNSAVMNVQRSHQLFKESKSQSNVNSPMQAPRNSTPEEEKLYSALVASLTTYREKMRGPLRFYSNQSYKDKAKSENSPEKTLKIDKKPLTDPLINSSELISDKGLKQDIGRIKDESADEILNKEIDERLGSGEGNTSGKIYKRFGKEPGQKPSEEHSEETTNLEDSDELKDDQRDDQPIKSAKNREDHTEVLMILEELPTIMGVDNKVYGPLYPQDIITMPQPNAHILIKNQKGRFIQRYK